MIVALERLGIDAPPSGFDIGPGWLPIVEYALEEMVAAGWDKRLGQVKQKFCRLCIYLDGATNEGIESIIAEAEVEADATCERCGKEREGRGSATGMALCSRCKEDE